MGDRDGSAPRVMTPEGLGYAAAWALALVFAAAGLAKATHPADVERQFTAMRLRRPALAARVLPVVELTVAVLLVVVPWVGAAAALALLAAFTVVLMRLLRSGFAEPCACFGASSRRRISFAELVRNAALLSAAFVALGAEVVRPSVTEIVVVVAWGAAVVGTLALIRVRFPPRRRRAPSRPGGPPRSV